MSETLFEELKRYVRWSPEDEAALRTLEPIARPQLPRISEIFYDRILEHEGARKSLQGGESTVGRLKTTLVVWMETLLSGPWDEAYYERRARIGRVHVRISLPQHYMFGAMNVLRGELQSVVDGAYLNDPRQRGLTRTAVAKIMDLELGIMLHTYREDLLAQQAKAERLSAFGQLVGSIGHELRNPLGVIESSLYILKTRLPEDERAKKHVERISQQVGIANEIIGNLLDLIRDRPLRQEPVLLREVLQAAHALVPVPETVHLTFEGLEDVPPVSGDPVPLRQAFTNLLQNAVQAVGASGTVAVKASHTEHFVEVSVQDSGPGVDPSVRHRLFEPLVSSKPKGIGLGLALVKRVVERHGGAIRYEARQGACFTVRLPLAKTAGGPQSAPENPEKKE